MQAGKGDTAVLLAVPGDLMAMPEADGDVVVPRLATAKIILDRTPTIIEETNEINETLMSVALHDMPEHTGATATAEDHGPDLRPLLHNSAPPQRGSDA